MKQRILPNSTVKPRKVQNRISMEGNLSFLNGEQGYSHLPPEQGVGSSNLPAPTQHKPRFKRGFFVYGMMGRFGLTMKKTVN